MKILTVVLLSTAAAAISISRAEAGDVLSKATQADCAKVKKLEADTSGGWVKDPALWLRVITSCPDRNIRTGAAIDLSHWITDNGQDTCTGLKEIESNLGPLLEALHDGATAQFLVEVLGGNWSGDKPLPCCMTPANKQRVVSALEQLITNRPREPMYWNDGLPKEALLHISECGP